MNSSVWSKAFLKACKPRPVMTLTEWADTFRQIAPGTSPEPGDWETSRVPYLQEPMDCCSDDVTEEVVMMCSSQIGKSELVINVLGYYAHQDPSPQLLIQPTLDAVEAFSKERIDPTFKYSPALRGLLDEGKDGRGAAKKSSNTIRMKHYPGGYIAMVGANSPSGLASRPIRVVLGDEIDRYSDTKEGDPLKLAIQRTRNFHNRKLVFVSTPTILGISKIHARFENSDQRRYHLPCPHCGGEQNLEWSNLKFKRDADGELSYIAIKGRDGEITKIPESIYYKCKHCAGEIYESEKIDMLAKGRWIASKPFRGVAGFHINAMYSPWTSWETLALMWIEVNRKRDKAGLMEFVNLQLGEPYVDKFEDIDEQYLLRRREYYKSELPDGVLLLTAGVDTQDNYLACEVVGWGKDRESWGIDYRIFMGDPARPEVWEQLDQHLQKQFKYDDGSALGVACVAIDSAGHRTTDVYNFCKPREYRRIFPIIGRSHREDLGREMVSKPSRKNKARVALFTVAEDTLKSMILSNVRLEEEGPNYCHYPRDDRGYDEEYFKGLLSEVRKTVVRGGQTRFIWEKVYERNEPLDCRKYAYAALNILNPDLDWLYENQDRKQMYVPQAEIVAASARKKRRVISKGI